MIQCGKCRERGKNRMLGEHTGGVPNQALEDGSPKAFRVAIMSEVSFMRGVTAVTCLWLLKSSLELMLQICSLYFPLSLGIFLFLTFDHLS